MSNRGFINPIFLIVAALLVAGGVTAWATGAFENADANTTTENNTPAESPSTNNVVANPECSSCPVTGKSGGMMDVVAGESDCSGCPSMKATVADQASGCSGCPSEAAAATVAAAGKAGGCADRSDCGGCADKSDCGGCADKSDCSGCEDKATCDGCPEKADCDGCEKSESCKDCPNAGCEDCPSKAEEDCCGSCGGKQ